VGSKAHRVAFVAWQMAAVSDRAAHARQGVAEEVGAGLFAELRTAEATLAEAEVALDEAQSVHDESQRVARESPQRIADLTAARAAAEQEVDALGLEVARLAEASAAAEQTAARLGTRLAELQGRSALTPTSRSAGLESAPPAGGRS
jgi:chromosome segregation ATPase